MKQTKVKIEYFKSWGSNKYYDHMKYESEINIGSTTELLEEAAEKMKSLVSEFHYTVEIEQIDGQAWNKYLILYNNE